MSSALAAANPLSSTIAANAPRRMRTRRRKNANTTSLSAIGQPRSGLRDSA